MEGNENLKNSFNGKEGNDVLSYVSAIANMEGGELVIGVKDQTLDIVGTDLSALTFNGFAATPLTATFKLVEQCVNLSSEGLCVEEFITEDTQKQFGLFISPSISHVALSMHIGRHGNVLPILW